MHARRVARSTNRLTRSPISGERLSGRKNGQFGYSCSSCRQRSSASGGIGWPIVIWYRRWNHSRIFQMHLMHHSREVSSLQIQDPDINSTWGSADGSNQRLWVSGAQFSQNMVAPEYCRTRMDGIGTEIVETVEKGANSHGSSREPIRRKPFTSNRCSVGSSGIILAGRCSSRRCPRYSGLAPAGHAASRFQSARTSTGRRGKLTFHCPPSSPRRQAVGAPQSGVRQFGGAPARRDGPAPAGPPCLTVSRHAATWATQL